MYQSEYQAKLTTPQKAVAAIQDGEALIHGLTMAEPPALLAAEEAIRERFARLMEAKAHKDESIKAGREYVEAYVVYVHFVEGLHNFITQGGAHDEH